MTLKQEQEEYLREGIEWTPVKYFNNKVICDLIEEKHVGIIALLDEECLRPGDASDLTFLDKMNERLASHPHYIFNSSRASLEIQKMLGRSEFKLRHYAGDVKYNVYGFLDKNNDLLFRNLKEAMSTSSNSIMKLLFPKNEFLTSRKRPETAITQFKNSLNNLMEILISKEPSYIRCIKPNEIQGPDSFNIELVRHQVKYLGLMENLRVRRAGFAYRRTYEAFLQRYKCLSAKTWPNWKGDPKAGVQIIADELKYTADDYRMGRTKIFIRLPKTLFATEDAFQLKKNFVASIIQARWKGKIQRRNYLQLRESVIITQSYCRRFLAKKKLKERRAAVDRIRFFIKGFITRRETANEFNEKFIKLVKHLWLVRLAKQLPKSFMNHQWPKPAAHCDEASGHLKKMHLLHLAKRYRDQMKPEKRKQFELKVMAEDLFKGKKKNYERSFPNWFINDRVPEHHKTQVSNFIKSQQFGERVVVSLKLFSILKSLHQIFYYYLIVFYLQYASGCMKYDRRGYKPRERILIVGDKSLFLLDAKTYKQKHRVPLNKIPNVVLTKEGDGLMLIRIPLELKKDKGDLILDIPQIIECSIWIITATNNKNIIQIIDSES